MAWAIEQKIILPDKKKLPAINAARIALHLPPFEIITDRQSDPTFLRPPVKSSPPPSDADMIVCRVNKPEIPEIKETPVADDPAITSANLRQLLIKELRDLQSGKSDPKRAMATAKLAAAIVETVKMEMDFIRLSREIKEAPLEGLPKPLMLA